MSKIKSKHNLMKKLLEGRKSYFSRKLNIILLMMFVVGVSSYIFKSQIGSFVWALRCKSPVVWNNIRINFPKGIAYKTYSDSIWFFYWDNPNNFLSIKEIDIKSISKESLVQFFESKGFRILETRDLTFKKHRSFTIAYVDNTSKLYYKRIYIVPKNLCLLYEGEMGKYADFNELIDSMEFLSENQGAGVLTGSRRGGGI